MAAGVTSIKAIPRHLSGHKGEPSMYPMAGNLAIKHTHTQHMHTRKSSPHGAPLHAPANAK